MRVEDVKKLRATLGCGLKEAHDAIERYGTYEAAMKALGPDVPSEKRDPYAEAVAARERWQNKASTYKYGLHRVQSASTLEEAIRIATESMVSGDSL
jgi:hypothetical protein